MHSSHFCRLDEVEVILPFHMNRATLPTDKRARMVIPMPWLPLCQGLNSCRSQQSDDMYRKLYNDIFNQNQ